MGGRNGPAGGEGDRLPLNQSDRELAREEDRTDLFTLPAPVALVRVDVPRIVLCPDSEVSHVAFHFHDFRLGKKMDEGMIRCFLHLRKEDGGGLLKAGKGSVHLQELSAKGRGFLYQI